MYNSYLILKCIHDVLYNTFKHNNCHIQIIFKWQSMVSEAIKEYYNTSIELVPTQ